MSKTYEYIHLVFATRERQRVLIGENRARLEGFLFALLKDQGHYPYRVTVMPEHVHMFFDKNKFVCIPELAQSIKGASSRWIKQNELFPYFQGWGKEYFAGSISSWDKDMIIKYVANQEKHHSGLNFVDEMKRLYASAGLIWHNSDLL